MDELNINNLPAEILTEVFRSLNGRNLKNATIVCRLWNNLIESAFRWTLELKYDWYGRLISQNFDDTEQKMNFILTTNRKFGTIKIDEGSLYEDHQIVEIFRRHGFSVVELHLHRCRIHNLRGFAKLLTFTPNLKHADVQIEIPHGSSDVLLMDQLLPDLKKLKSLMIRGIDCRISKCFRKAKLKTMEIRGYMRKEDRSLMVDFLSTQDKLTTLTVDSLFSPSILVEMGKPSVSISFRLTQLSISNIFCQKQSQNYQHLQRFIESQAGNLTEIEMIRISSSVYECVFASMTKLRTLSVKIKDLPRNNDFYDRLKENCNVHTVKLRASETLDSDQFVHQFLQKLPNVCSLILTNTNRFSSKNILAAAQSLSKLESLYIAGKIHEDSFDCVKFPNLKTMDIQHWQGKINWNEFTKAHPLLTELTIETMEKESYLTSHDIDQMTTNIDLQHIRLGAGFVADNRFFAIVGSNCKNLKVLDLDKSCISQNLGHYLKIDVLRLRESITSPKTFRPRLYEIN